MLSQWVPPAGWVAMVVVGSFMGMCLWAYWDLRRRKIETDEWDERRDGEGEII